MSNYNPNNHHRRSIRLKGYDYSQKGLYFITICVHNNLFLFGDVKDGQLILNEAGMMVDKWYYELPNKFPDIRCHQMVVMPNHFHCIIENVGDVGADLCVSPYNDQYTCLDGEDEYAVTHLPDSQTLGEHTGSPLHRVVQWFKTMTTNEYIRNVKTNSWPPFDGKLWQRNYWEHIIRNEDSFINISQYIANNPAKWHEDQLNINY